MDILFECGKRIKSLRNAAGLTQEQLAEKADLHYSYIGQLERGEKNITFKTFFKVCDALEISIPDFFAFLPKDYRNPSYPDMIYELISNENSDTQKRLYNTLKVWLTYEDKK